MWLLNTHTAELKFFSGPDEAPGGYAILSHVWGNPGPVWNPNRTPDEEDTFQKVQSAFQEFQENACRPSDDSASSTPCEEATLQTISSLSAQVRDLSTQVHHLTGQLKALISSLKEHDPVLTALFSTHSDRVSSPSPQCTTIFNRPSCASPTTHPHTDARDRLSPKIRSFLLKAEEHGFDWAWADTCCIDKTSSAELTEAINSMFQYYSHSEVCYAYLSDVRPAPTPGAMPRRFGSSSWHSRGWTLQELIAPKVVIFMANDWTRIGTKYELAEKMAKSIQGCPPASVLRFEKEITDMSVAQRMAWAALRRTTRVEDEAYCLFGIFGINIPTLYGEGKNAFYRLQEEIMRTSTDTSIIAWCSSGSDFGDISTFSSLRTIKDTIRSNEYEPRYDNSEYLFTPSPSRFLRSRNMSTTMSKSGLDANSSVS